MTIGPGTTIPTAALPWAGAKIRLPRLRAASCRFMNRERFAIDLGSNSFRLQIGRIVE